MDKDNWQQCSIGVVNDRQNRASDLVVFEFASYLESKPRLIESLTANVAGHQHSKKIRCVRDFCIPKMMVSFLNIDV